MAITITQSSKDLYIDVKQSNAANPHFQEAEATKCFAFLVDKQTVVESIKVVVD